MCTFCGTMWSQSIFSAEALVSTGILLLIPQLPASPPWVRFNLEAGGGKGTGARTSLTFSLFLNFWSNPPSPPIDHSRSSIMKEGKEKKDRVQMCLHRVSCNCHEFLMAFQGVGGPLAHKPFPGISGGPSCALQLQFSPWAHFQGHRWPSPSSLWDDSISWPL